jgi:molybdate transport system ATP-binding protein
MTRITARFRGTLGRFRINVAFTAPVHGVTALFGPSGCGKTTILRCIAGLQRLPEGFLSVDDQVWQDDKVFQPPHRRPVGYVFQEASLFPHLSVRRNLTYGLRRSGAGETVARFDDVVSLLGLGPLLDRSPERLSGGERQRVAVGRALLAQPWLLLMDEPLSALDRLSKDEILPYLETLHETLSIPMLYVSHDLAEVERLADHLVLLSDGAVLACGPLAEIQSDPRLPLARMPEAGVALEATVQAFDIRYGLTTLNVDGGRLLVPGRAGDLGRRRRVLIAASDVSLAKRPPVESTILNTLPSRIVGAEAQDGIQINVVVRLGQDGQGARLIARITRKSWDRLDLAQDSLVYVQVKSVALADRPRVTLAESDLPQSAGSMLENAGPAALSGYK